MLSRFLLLSFAFFLPTFLPGQSDLSGIINNYTAVSAIEYCSATLTVDESDDFSVGDLVLLIQMQGTTVSTGNNSSYGNIVDLNGAGQYEYGRIAVVDGSEISLSHTLLYMYDLSSGVQLVRVPEYSSAIVTGSLMPVAWNGSTGGVLALSVSDTLWLEAGMDANGMGFRGGTLQTPESDCFWLFNESDYFYSAGAWEGARKGEGVAMEIVNQESGRGALANAGGGGNDHNTGGGGGANLSVGGIGGEQTSPSAFGCSGDFPGIGGKALPADSGLFLGGGGGAGHADNGNAGSSGGAGGGIIIIEANTLIGNGNMIEARGQSPDLADGDGAGGGGAGGTIVFLVENWVEIALSVLGGEGGSTKNVADRCFGPGGGGAGGVIYGDVPNLPVSGLEGGLPGENLNSNSNCPDLTNGALAGGIGSQEDLLEIPMSADEIIFPEIEEQPIVAWDACVGNSAILSLIAYGSDLSYQWQINTGSGFEDLVESFPYSGTNSSNLALADPQVSMTGYTFQCIITSVCFGELITTSSTLEVLDLPDAGFSFSQVDNTVNFEALDPGADDYMWDFGDMNMGAGSPVEHTYLEDGIYIVELTATNFCGSDVFSDTIYIGAAPEANFSLDLPSGCAPFTVQFTDLSTGDPDYWLWDFPGGDPVSSDQQNPTVLYEVPGSYDVNLEVGNGFGSTMINMPGAITVLEQPTALFDYTISGDSAFFENLSTGDIFNYQWTFGDGSDPSEEENPIHEFPGPGIYEVTLSVSNSNCGSFITLTVEIMVVGITDLAGCEPRIYPQPAVGRLNLELCPTTSYPLEVILYNTHGKAVFWEVRSNPVDRWEIDLSAFPAGMYFIAVEGEGVREVMKVVKL